MVERLAACEPRDCFISVITEFELVQGAARAPAEHRASEDAKVSRFVGALRILSFDSECAWIAARINANLLNAGTPVGVTDVFIAATALRHKRVVVTNNTRDFRRIEGLSLEDWR